VSQEKLQRPTTPCSGIELLNYAEANDGNQVLAYKQLANGAARSSYTLAWYSDSQLFDVFADIADDWEELSRQDFYNFHGKEEHIWHLYE